MFHCWASSQWRYTVSRTPCHGAWTSAPLSAHPSTERCCTAPQIETPIFSCRTTTHQFIWQQQHKCGAVGGLLMECGVGGQPHKTLHFNSRHRYMPPGMTLPTRAWVRLNRLRTGVGRFRSCLHKWGMAPSAACECGAWWGRTNRQPCRPPMSNPSTSQRTARPDDETTEWLLKTCPEI